jgi:hypothetical protein
MGSTSNNGFFIYRYNQQLALDSFGATRYSDATFFTENTWQHLVVTHSSGTNNIYLDGSFVDTFSYTWNIDATATTYLGAQIGSYSRYLNGKLDQVRIFDKALSSSEVTTLYGENNTSTTKSTTDIFDDGSGIALYEFEEAAKDTGGVNGYIDAAGVFNGSSSYIPISQGSFDISTMSLGSWFNTSNTSQNYQTIFNNYSQTSGQNRGWYVRYETGGNIRVRGFSSSNSEVLDALISTTINQNEWYHIVVTITSTEVKIYKNGSQIGTTQSLSSPIGYSSYAGLPTIGAYRSAISTYANYFNGKIDQVRIFNKALSSSEVTTLYGETSASATKSTTDIFDDGSGVALYELEGNANDSGRFGRGAIDSGQSAVFNGTTSIFNFPNTAYGASTTVFTVSGWFKHTSAANSREDIYFGNGATVSGNTGYALFTDYTSGNIALSFRDTDQSQVFYTSSSNIKDGSWYHLCLTYNNGAYVVYLNGASILNGTSPDFINNQTPTYATYIGNRYGDTGANRSLVGAVDQVRVYSSALSASDVKALISEINVPTTNLTAHYKLDGNANDETGTYNGTASNLTYSDPAEFPTYDGTATNVSYAYDGTPTNVSFVGTSFEPDLVWIKSRSNATSNELHDSVRGEPSRLFSNLTNAESANYDGFVSMDSNGFNLDNTGDGGQVNFNGRTYVAWCWKAADTTVTDSSTGTVTTNYRANTEAGFSIVKFVGASGANYVPHGLSQAPELFIMKSVNVSGNWGVYVKDLGADKYLLLNSTADAATSTGVWNNTHPTSELLHWQGGLIAAGGSGQYNNIAYCFHSVDGYQKVGSYSGNGATGNFINVGFRPRFVMIKSTTASSTSWVMIDSLRDNADEWLYANESSATFDDANTYTELNSNGFTVNSTASYVNASGNTYIYLAIA